MAWQVVESAVVDAGLVEELLLVAVTPDASEVPGESSRGARFQRGVQVKAGAQVLVSVEDFVLESFVPFWFLWQGKEWEVSWV